MNRDPYGAYSRTRQKSGAFVHAPMNVMMLRCRCEHEQTRMSTKPASIAMQSPTAKRQRDRYESAIKSRSSAYLNNHAGSGAHRCGSVVIVNLTMDASSLASSARHRVRLTATVLPCHVALYTVPNRPALQSIRNHRQRFEESN